MNRRAFFRFLPAAPAVAVAASVPAVSPAPAAPVHVGAIPTCECGRTLMRMMAECVYGPECFCWCENKRCRLFHVPFSRPRVALEPADPEMVKRVIAYEAELARRFSASRTKYGRGWPISLEEAIRAADVRTWR